jgi:DNA repair photolyase
MSVKPEVRLVIPKSILTKQFSGFLTSLPYSFSHTLSPYIGCGFGGTGCGSYCYARALMSWRTHGKNVNWGSLVLVKQNAPSLLEATLCRLTSAARQRLRIFMAPGTDSYQPIEVSQQLTRRCLEVFTRYQDLGLQVIQTRAPLAHRDFDLMQCIPYVWLSVSIETDDADLIRRLGGGPSPQARLALVHAAVQRGINTQIAVSPALPSSPDFGSSLLKTGTKRIIVDTFVDGDGSGGARTASSPFGRTVPRSEWTVREPALALADEI